MDDVEKALLEADLGMAPTSDGKVFRLNVPMLTQDRRKELAKQAGGIGEVAKVAIRNVRGTALKEIEKMKKSLSEDVIKDAEDSLQKAVKKTEDELAEAVKAREQEILT